MSYIVETSNEWFLRGTLWTGEIERANKFPTIEAATIALNTAKKFMKPAAFKAATIREILDTPPEA